MFLNPPSNILGRLVIIQFFFNKSLQLGMGYNFLAMELGIFSPDIGLVVSFRWIISSFNPVSFPLIIDGRNTATERIGNILERIPFLP